MKKTLMIISATALLMSGITAAEAKDNKQADPQDRCTICHTVNEGGKRKIGPNLFGIMGKEAGTSKGFKYGSYLKESNFVWDEVNMRAWIKDSRGVATAAGLKTRMISQKYKDSEADAVIEFLKSLK